MGEQPADTAVDGDSTDDAVVIDAEPELVTLVVGEQSPDIVEQPSAETSWPMDEICAAAIELAREALLEEADPGVVGEHVSMLADGPLVVTHYFKGSVPGYTGWQWSVTVTRAPDSEHVTVDETALLPDESALLAQAWVPWRRRVQPGDLGTSDVMVTDVDDPRLVPGMSDNDLPDPDPVDGLRPEQWELGLGRVRMLSPEGRRDAAQRWYREVGPRAAQARATQLECATCGFLLLIGGPLGQGFGVCANGLSPVDGRVVALDFGCGAHSETQERPSVGVAETVVDEMSYDEMGTAGDEAEQPAESDGQSEAGGVTETAAALPEPAPEAEQAAVVTPIEADDAASEHNTPDAGPDGAGEASAPDENTGHARMHEPGSKEGT